MKNCLVLLMLLGFSHLSFAEGISACSEDSYSSKRIEKEVPENERVTLFNADDEMVGVVHAVGDQLVALYLCGDNPGYFYADGSLKSFKFSGFSVIYNDEYDVEILGVEHEATRTKMTIHVESYGSSDYESFTDSFYFLN
ncbi:MAG: hypothetical protein H6621_07100 [Halobacteriovoraceae bacterium]|nr:hypothetical protein [Halobacteriovoraceae bacterium]